MTDQDWREILELHDRAPLHEYVPANIQPDAAIVDPDGITF